MPAFLFVLVVRVVEAVCRQWRKARAPKPRPLCTECSHAHVQYAVNGRRAIACTFAGAVRPVLLDVLYCTDYRDRNAAPCLVSIGFAHEVVDADIGTEAAIVQHGFSTSGGPPNRVAAASSAGRLFRAPPVHSTGMDRQGWAH